MNKILGLQYLLYYTLNIGLINDYYTGLDKRDKQEIRDFARADFERYRNERDLVNIAKKSER